MIPKLVLGAFSLLLLSWMFFMVHYLWREAERRRVSLPASVPAHHTTNGASARTDPEPSGAVPALEPAR